MPTKDVPIDFSKKREPQKRKVVQFSTIEHPLGYAGFAVTDDGLIFRCQFGFAHSGITWEKLTEIPQD